MHFRCRGQKDSIGVTLSLSEEKALVKLKLEINETSSAVRTRQFCPF
jgi:hypothetical protein